MDYQTAATVCPKCGSSDQVRTARELLDTMTGVREQAFQRMNQLRQSGQGQGPGQGPGPGWNSDSNDDYDHYNVEGSDPNLRRDTSRDFGLGSGGDNVIDDIGGAVFGAALGFAGRAIGKRMKRAFEEKVMPAVEARAARAQQQFEESQAEREAIAARYPELRSCLKDQVIFLEGGYRTVPISELSSVVTLAQADDVVARLR